MVNETLRKMKKQLSFYVEDISSSQGQERNWIYHLYFMCRVNIFNLLHFFVPRY